MIRGRPSDGERYLERWLALQEKAKTPPSEKQAKVRLMLAAASMERKAYGEAEQRLAKAQAVLEEVNGAESDEVTKTILARASVAVEAGRFDDAEGFIRKSLQVQSGLIGPDDADMVQATALMVGGYKAHADDPNGSALWNRLESLAKKVKGEYRHDVLSEILENYAELLRRTNRAVLRPTEQDLVYLKKIGAVSPSQNLDGLAGKTRSARTLTTTDWSTSLDCSSSSGFT